MNLTAQQIEELEMLAGAFRDGEATDAQVERLNVLMDSDPEVIEYFASYMELCGELRRRHAVEHLRDLTSLESETSPRRWRISAAWFSDTRMAVAAAILLMATLTVAMLVDAQRRSDAYGVAVLMSAIDAQWEDPRMNEDLVGRNMPAGHYKLKHGFVQFQFHGGVMAVVEGPAEFDLRESDLAYMSRGKIRAYVPEQAIGFRIDAPDLEVIDLGTEFGLHIEPEKRSEVHVFKGAVRYVSSPKSVITDAGLLGAGLGVHIDSAGRAQAIEADAKAFVDVEAMQGMVEREAQHRFARWQVMREQVKADTSLLAYYTFERGHAPNIAMSAKASDGTVVGATPARGRWPGKDALDFRGSFGRVHVDVPGSHRSLAFAAWVNLESIPHGFNTLLLTDGWDSGEPHWQVRGDGRLVLGVGGRGGASGGDYVSASVVFNEGTFNRWVHLATVYDAEKQRVTHYMNGHSVGSEPMRTYLPLTIGSARIGGWSHGNRTLQGRVGELLIYARPLDEDKVRQLYESGRPAPTIAPE